MKTDPITFRAASSPMRAAYSPLTHSFSNLKIGTPTLDAAIATNNSNFYTYELLQSIAEWLKKRVDIRPTVGIICGSGLGSLADTLTERNTFPYEIIPHFPKSTVHGHEGQLVFGKLKGVPVVCMQGRFHYYEGYPLWKCSMPIRVMKLIGVNQLIVTNAAGGLHADYQPGDIMIMKDHVNLMGFAGNNPLQGVNEERFGPRFIAMNRAYDKELRDHAKKISKDLGIESYVREGVYAVLGGPNFETIAELRLLKTCGVDAVGMSTVHEVLTAHHAGMRIFAFSLISNKCVTDYDDDYEVNHAEVIDTGKMREPILKELVTRMVMKMCETDNESESLNNIDPASFFEH
ncbi:purine nucleoside phosphorylase [Nilaparvata lugens]|nr:purine nucleoside phosphorylase [Nilaparvata lugens]